MKMTRKDVSDGVAYARKEAYEYDGKQYEADVQHGDLVTIQDAGIKEDHPQYGETYKFVTTTRNGDKRSSFNQSTINALIDVHGDDSEQWVGKQVKVWIRRAVIGGEKRLVAYFLPGGWFLDDFGSVEKDSAAPEPIQRPEPVEKTEGQKAVEAAQDIKPEDIPF